MASQNKLSPVISSAADSNTCHDASAGRVRERVDEQERKTVPVAVIPSPYKTIEEAADYLRTSPWAVAQAIRAGDLPRAKIGKRFVLRVQELDEYFSRKIDVA